MVIEPPQLPAHDPTNPVENAIINSLARSWPMRARVKKREPNLDDLFDPNLADYPEELIPFREHDWYRELDEASRNRIRAWAWIAYNKSVIDIEQYVVNPGFTLLAQDVFGTGLGDSLVTATTQAMVDEQYHTLMHHNANVLTRRRRGWELPDRALPRGRTVAEHNRACRKADTERDEALIRLAYTTVAETSISAYLGLMSEAPEIQEVNRTTVAMHRRDEYCHASIAGELMKVVYEKLPGEDRELLIASMNDAIGHFTGSDFETWRSILKLENIANADSIIDELAEAAKNARIVQDCSAMQRLCDELGVADQLTVANAFP